MMAEFLNILLNGPFEGDIMELFNYSKISNDKIFMNDIVRFKEIAEDLASEYEIKILWEPQRQKILSIADFFLRLADCLARQREYSGRSLKKVYGLPCAESRMDFTYFKKSVSILASADVVEVLARHFSLLEWNVRSISAHELDNFDFEPGECILMDQMKFFNFELTELLQQKPSYLGFIGTKEEALQLLYSLKLSEDQQAEIPLFAPAGLEIGAKNLSEVGLSVVAEILHEMSHYNSAGRIWL